jgi:cell division transport system permease protein
MISTRFGLASRRLPLGRHDAMRLLPWGFAAMVFVAGLGGVGLLATRDVLRAADQSIGARMTLTAPAGASDARLKTILALLRQTAGITAVQELTPADTAALLTPWLGPAAPLDVLPVPRVVDMRIAPDRTIDLATLRQHLTAVDPEARLDDHQAWLDALRRAAHRVERVLAGIIAAGLLLVVPAAAFATRTALVVDHPTVELVHLLGAGDGDIARHIAARVLAAALLGGALGGIAVLLTLAALGDVRGLLAVPAAGHAPGLADWRVWAVVVAVALAAAAIAAASAQALALRRLAAMP